MNTSFSTLEEKVESRVLDRMKQQSLLVNENAGQNREPSAKYRELELDNDDRHWSPASQWYAPADVLLQYLRDGWRLDDDVEICVHRCRSYRHVEMYHFILYHAEKKSLRMPVVANPVVRRIVQQYSLNALYVFNEAPANNTD
ncbi:hypothetical protein G4Y79_01860 [Phototrophicus methaneseepsis]|uniref:Uncharacterized protein n=1 Tax=Phototrophicus methaneseepsis TaxID=2710758 RepID=A0A7S8IF49_9CHLR|nr:hypothetical protein [Phototrophicus methaneseepsis]QPC83144.1 hypothetical protein G4Y79_01860 [Phototrophicus methaneseepsis]